MRKYTQNVEKNDIFLNKLPFCNYTYKSENRAEGKNRPKQPTNADFGDAHHSLKKTVSSKVPATTVEDILNATHRGLDYFKAYFHEYDLKEIQKGKEWRSKGSGKISIRWYHDRWYAYDFSSGEHGDIFTWAAREHLLDTEGQNFSLLLQKLSEQFHVAGSGAYSFRTTPKPLPKRPAYKPNAGKEPKKSFEYVLGTNLEIRNHIFSRWYITPEILDEYGILPIEQVFYHSGRTVAKTTSETPIFLFKAGENLKAYSPLKPIFGRSRNGQQRKTTYLQSSGNYVFGYDQLPTKCKAIIIAAGQKDTLALNTVLNPYDIYAICLNSEGAKLPHELLADFRTRTKHVFVLYDNDETGIRQSEKLAKESKLIRLSIPTIFNDVGDYLEARNPDQLIQEIQAIIPGEEENIYLLLFKPVEAPLFEDKWSCYTVALDTIELTVSKPPIQRVWGDFGKKGKNDSKDGISSQEKPKISAHQWLLNQQKRNKKDVKKLTKMANSCSCEDAALIVRQIAHKKAICSHYLLLRELPTEELLRKGQNFCKHKACHICNYIVSRERKRATLAYIKEHAEEFEGKNFFHLVLTLQHDQENRNGDYSGELIEHFKWLRNGKAKFEDIDGEHLNNRKWWKKYVEGGFYSMEVVGNKSDNPQDHSLHIHLHILLVSELDLDSQTIDFQEQVRKRWLHRTTDSNQVKLERAYILNESREKEYYHPGDGIEKLENTLSETCKYSLKMDMEDMDELDGETLASLLMPGKRYFNFFGCLYGKGITKFDYKDIEEIVQGDEIFSPSTGQVFQQSETKLAISNIANLTYEEINGYPVYDYKDPRKKIYPDTNNLHAELSRMNQQHFTERLRKRAKKLVDDGIYVKDYEALIEELSFTGGLFGSQLSLGNTLGEISLSAGANKASKHIKKVQTDKTFRQKEVERKEGIKEIEVLKPTLELQKHKFSSEEYGRVEQSMQEAEAKAGISRDMIQDPVFDNEQFADCSNAFKASIHDFLKIADFKTKQRIKKGEIFLRSSMTEEDKHQLTLNTIEKRLNLALKRQVKGFEGIIEVEGVGYKIIPQATDKPLGCTVIGLMNILYGFAAQKGRLEADDNVPF